MADSYTKLFSDIVDSSIWTEDAETRIVWITLLALCNNSDGYVRGSVGWLAGKAHVKPEVCETALKKFAEPDHHSRTPDNEGRRIEFLEDGWLILNYMAFRDRLSTNPKTVKTRERVKKHRERYSALRNAPSVTQRYTDSASVSASVPESQGKESEKGGRLPEIEVPSWSEVQIECQKIGLVEWRARDWFDEMQQSGWRDNKGREVMDWRAYLARVRTWWERDGRPMAPKTRINGERTATPMDLKTILQAKENKAAQLRTKFCSDTAIDSVWSNADRKNEFFALKREIKQLNNQLSNMA